MYATIDSISFLDWPHAEHCQLNPPKVTVHELMQIELCKANFLRLGCFVVHALGLIGSHLYCEGVAGIHELRHSSQLCAAPHGMTDCIPFGQ